MNAYNPDVFKTEALPMPLTDIDQSGYKWFKFGHIDYLLEPRIAALKLAEQGALTRLMAHAARQVPFGSLPNDPIYLAAVVGLSMPRWAKMADTIMQSVFTLCADNRFYCALMTDQLTNVPEVEHGEQAQQNKRSKKQTVSAELSAKRAEAAAASHAKRKANLQNDDSELQNGVAKVANDELQNSKPIANQLQNGGIKGGDLDSDSEQDLEKEKKKQTHTAPKASGDYKTQLEDIFSFWKNTFSKPNSTLFDAKRRTNVLNRLKDGYTVEQIKDAITGCSQTPYNIENGYTDLELICRDITKIDRFISIAKKPVAGNVNAQYQSQIKDGQQLTAEQQAQADADWAEFQAMNGAKP